MNNLSAYNFNAEEVEPSHLSTQSQQVGIKPLLATAK